MASLSSILTFNKKYFLLTVILFITEVLIAVYMKAGFVRHYFGDFLVVILLYCFVKSFIKVPVLYATIAVLLFAYFMELLQYLNFVQWVGLEDNRLAKVVLGNYFELADMLAYTLGMVTVLIIERINNPPISINKVKPMA